MNQLTHVDEFRKALTNYKLSSEARTVLKAVRLVLLVAPSASGRNTIIQELVKYGNYYFIVSDTTREPRINNGILEQNGREYWFRSEEEMLDEIKNGDFLEAAVIHNQQVSGVSIRELAKAKENGKIALTDVEIIGAANIHRVKSDATIVFMVPPSFDIWIERIHSRSKMPPDELIRRLESAKREFTTALKADYYTFMLNDTVEGTTAEMDRLLTKGIYDPFKEKLARETAERLLHEVEVFLENKSLPELNSEVD